MKNQYNSVCRTPLSRCQDYWMNISVNLREEGTEADYRPSQTWWSADRSPSLSRQRRVCLLNQSSAPQSSLSPQNRRWRDRTLRELCADNETLSELIYMWLISVLDYTECSFSSNWHLTSSFQNTFFSLSYLLFTYYIFTFLNILFHFYAIFFHFWFLSQSNCCSAI